MNRILRMAIVTIGCAIALTAENASAQTPAETPAPKLITYRGMQAGVDVTAARNGEIGFYWGASSTYSVLALRFTAMDESIAVPCSVGVMYEHLFRQNRTRIMPVAGASLTRVFSCASDSDGARPSPDVRSVATFSGGVRIPMFAGHRTVGSLKVLAFTQRRIGTTSSTDTSSQGVTLGFVIGRR